VKGDPGRLPPFARREAGADLVLADPGKRFAVAGALEEMVEAGIAGEMRFQLVDRLRRGA